jgi:hypothetical protein
MRRLLSSNPRTSNQTKSAHTCYRLSRSAAAPYKDHHYNLFTDAAFAQFHVYMAFLTKTLEQLFPDIKEQVKADGGRVGYFSEQRSLLKVKTCTL